MSRFLTLTMRLKNTNKISVKEVVGRNASMLRKERFLGFFRLVGFGVFFKVSEGPGGSTGCARSPSFLQTGFWL